MTDLMIRAAMERDLDGMVKVLEQSSGGAQEVARRWIESGGTRVAESDGHIVGFSVTAPTFFGNEFVEMLRVSTDARRRGAASKLLRAVSAHRSTEKLFTSTNLSNTPMQALLNRLGWESAGIVYGLDERDPELFYQAPPR